MARDLVGASLTCSMASAWAQALMALKALRCGVQAAANSIRKGLSLCQAATGLVCMMGICEHETVVLNSCAVALVDPAGQLSAIGGRLPLMNPTCVLRFALQLLLLRGKVVERHITSLARTLGSGTLSKVALLSIELDRFCIRPTQPV